MFCENSMRKSLILPWYYSADRLKAPKSVNWYTTDVPR